jgi:AcrR family transcriptional regulator
MVSLVSATPPTTTPRERHRQRTREEILDAAIAVVIEHGAAALNLSEVARRVGLRQPSLYQYFDSRLAVYDALFERATKQHLGRVASAVAASRPGLPALRTLAATTVASSAESPALTPLLFRPAVPGFTPSAAAGRHIRAARRLVENSITAAVDRRELHRAAASRQGVAMADAIIAGVTVLQLGYDPFALPAKDRRLPLVQPAIDMFSSYFSPDKPPDWTP